MMNKLHRDKVITHTFDKLNMYDQDAIPMSFLYSIALGKFLDLYVETLKEMGDGLN